MPQDGRLLQCPKCSRPPILDFRTHITSYHRRDLWTEAEAASIGWAFCPCGRPVRSDLVVHRGLTRCSEFWRLKEERGTATEKKRTAKKASSGSSSNHPQSAPSALNPSREHAQPQPITSSSIQPKNAPVDWSLLGDRPLPTRALPSPPRPLTIRLTRPTRPIPSRPNPYLPRIPSPPSTSQPLATSSSASQLSRAIVPTSSSIIPSPPAYSPPPSNPASFNNSALAPLSTSSNPRQSPPPEDNQPLAASAFKPEQFPPFMSPLVSATPHPIPFRPSFFQSSASEPSTSTSSSQPLISQALLSSSLLSSSSQPSSLSVQSTASTSSFDSDLSCPTITTTLPLEIYSLITSSSSWSEHKDLLSILCHSACVGREGEIDRMISSGWEFSRVARELGIGLPVQPLGESDLQGVERRAKGEGEEELERGKRKRAEEQEEDWKQEMKELDELERIILRRQELRRLMNAAADEQ